jgi:hypothetical protein
MITEHKLCQSGMQWVMSVGDTQVQTIRKVVQFGCIPPWHKGKDKVAHNAIKKMIPFYNTEGAF